MDSFHSERGNPYENDGIVEAVSNGVARVRMDRPPRCGTCCACASMDRGSMAADIEAIPGLKPGDRVRVGLDPRSVWRATFWTFVLPLLALVGGAAGGWHFTGLQQAVGLSADATAGVCGFGLMAGSFGFGILRNRRLERRADCQPRILRRL